jgi:hypothetical protein
MILRCPHWECQPPTAIAAEKPQGHSLDSKSESGGATWSTVPAASYTLNGPGISCVTFTRGGENYSAFSSILLDGLTFPTEMPAVPEPHTCIIWLLLAGLGIGVG